MDNGKVAILFLNISARLCHALYIYLLWYDLKEQSSRWLFCVKVLLTCSHPLASHSYKS